ncbi:MAG: hypothetical protein WA864_23085 [Acetobacteraceae bacterium]
MIADGEVVVLSPPVTQIGGIGDLLAHSVGLPMLKQISGSAHVIFQSPPQLHKLFTASFPGIELHGDTHEVAIPFPTPRYDRGVPLYDLREMLKADGIAEPIPHLFADPELVEHYRRLMPKDAIGLCWSNGGGQRDYKSWLLAADVPLREEGCDDGLWTCRPPLADLRPLWSRMPVVSLQTGTDRQQATDTDVIDVLPDEPDIADIAAVVACCRSVISAQWTVSHLTSGMGVELHLLGFHDVWPHPRCTQEWAHHQQHGTMQPPPPYDFTAVAEQLAVVLAA